MAQNGQQNELNDPAAFAGTLERLLPELGTITYLPVYGPQVALFFSPLARLSFPWALVVWTMCSALIYGVCGWAVWRHCPSLRGHGRLVAVVAIANPAFVNLIAHGQNSAIALGLFTLAFLALQHGRPFVAGLAIGTLAFKPQLGLVAAVVFLFNREWRVVIGALLAAAAQGAAVWMAYGAGPIVAYMDWLPRLAAMTDQIWVKPYQMHSLSAFWALLLPWRNVALAAYAATAVATIAVTYRVWRTAADLRLRFAFVVIASALVSPHLYVYDLIILVPVHLMAVEWAIGNSQHALAPAARGGVYFAFALPLLGVLAQIIRVQLSVVALTVLTVALWVITDSRVPVANHGPLRRPA
jgi:hypothetical protein